MDLKVDPIQEMVYFSWQPTMRVTKGCRSDFLMPTGACNPTQEGLPIRPGNIYPVKTQMHKLYTLFKTGISENHTLSSCISPHNKGVPPSPLSPGLHRYIIHAHIVHVPWDAAVVWVDYRASRCCTYTSGDGQTSCSYALFLLQSWLLHHKRILRRHSL